MDLGYLQVAYDTLPDDDRNSWPGESVPASVVEEEIRKNGEFHNTLSIYSHASLLHSLRSTACHGLHSLEQCRAMDSDDNRSHKCNQL